MTYKGYRIDRKKNVFDLNERLVIEKAESIEAAKAAIDKILESEHKNKTS